MENPLKKYVERARVARSHVAKQVVLADLFRDVFGIELEEVLPGIEKKVGSRVLGRRGSIDLLVRGVVFEVKTDLKKELEDARDQLKKYFQALLEEDPTGKYVGIATDGINFIAYAPVIFDNRVVDINKISSIDLSKATYKEAILWLDSFIFSKSKIKPSAEDLKWRFGPGSPTYSLAVDELRRLWNEVKDKESAKLKLSLWRKSMEIVYGSEPEESAFIDHTYLVTLVKLIVYLRLSGEEIITKEKIKDALTGKYFTQYGITNLIEEDFFSWILDDKIAGRSLELACGLAKELLRYDLSQIDEDFFKEIYQEIVKRGQRHRIGEYYTPEWLAELTLKEALSIWWRRNDKLPKILDPACGSGTFLCNAIRIFSDELSKRGWNNDEILNFMLNNIVGVDINPLAVIIARANYLLALGDLLYLGKTITIPIYLADSIKIPEISRSLYRGIRVYSYKLDSISLNILANVVQNAEKFGTVINAFKEAIHAYKEEIRRNEKNKKNNKEIKKRARNIAYAVFKRELPEKLNVDELNTLIVTLNDILNLIDKGQDSIWVFMLSNIYAPVILMEQKFDIIVGNPPWIAMRYIENKDYQDFLKKQVFEYELLDKSQVNLFTQMEAATLFFCRTSDLYLKEGGIIAFVMPRSVLTGALQHLKFKQFKKPKMKLIKIIDLENVSPLFNVPSCVLLAIKGGETRYPVSATMVTGRLPSKNVKLATAIKYLLFNNYAYKPPQTPIKKSYYYDLIKAGASIYPRCFYFIEFVVKPNLGIDIQKPLVKTSEEVMKKKPWKDIRLQGNVEAEFIYATLLGGDILPFGYTKLRPVVLPIEPRLTGYRLLNVESLKNKGFIYMAEWMAKAQKLWEKYRSKRSEKRFPSVLDRLDYNGLLSSQNPSIRYILLYNTAGTNIVSCVVDKRRLQPFSIGKITIYPRGFIAETKTMFYETNSELEAHYLSAILNSNIINRAIKPLQTKGLFGERDIVRRPFMFPIPKFDRNNPIHLKLAELSKICHHKVASLRFTKKSVASMREEARKAIRRELEEIDKLVSKLLGI